MRCRTLKINIISNIVTWFIHSWMSATRSSRYHSLVVASFYDNDASDGTTIRCANCSFKTSNNPSLGNFGRPIDWGISFQSWKDIAKFGNGCPRGSKTYAPPDLSKISDFDVMRDLPIQ